MGFKEQLKSLLEDKLNNGSANILESIEELAKDSELTESQHTTIVNAVQKYTDSATDKLVDTIVEAAAEKYGEAENELKESYDEKLNSLDESAKEYGEYLKEEYETLAERYTQDVVIPELTESVDAYMNVMLSKMDEEGANGVNVLKSTKYDELVESLSAHGFHVKPIAESEEELSELENVQNKLAEANAEIKRLGAKLAEKEEDKQKTIAEDIIGELTEGLSDLQKSKVQKFASSIDEKREDFREVVESLVETVKGKQAPTDLNEDVKDDENGDLNSNDNNNMMGRYLKYAQPKRTRF